MAFTYTLEKMPLCDVLSTVNLALKHHATEISIKINGCTADITTVFPKEVKLWFEE